MLYLSYFYKARELSIRMAVFYAALSMANIFDGFISVSPIRTYTLIAIVLSLSSTSPRYPD